MHRTARRRGGSATSVRPRSGPWGRTTWVSSNPRTPHLAPDSARSASPAAGRSRIESSTCYRERGSAAAVRSGHCRWSSGPGGMVSRRRRTRPASASASAGLARWSRVGRYSIPCCAGTSRACRRLLHRCSTSCAER
eukprot:scaffold15045_cov66-Phaeocystis_antarctica.AAC.3